MKQMKQRHRTESQLQRDAIWGWWERLTPEKQGDRLFEDFYKAVMENHRRWINNQDRPEDIALMGHRSTGIIIDEVATMPESNICPDCNGVGHIAAHNDQHDPETGDCIDCPVKRICDRCSMTGKITR